MQAPSYLWYCIKLSATLLRHELIWSASKAIVIIYIQKFHKIIRRNGNIFINFRLHIFSCEDIINCNLHGVSSTQLCLWQRNDIFGHVWDSTRLPVKWGLNLSAAPPPAQLWVKVKSWVETKDKTAIYPYWFQTNSYYDIPYSITDAIKQTSGSRDSITQSMAYQWTSFVAMYESLRILHILPIWPYQICFGKAITRHGTSVHDIKNNAWVTVNKDFWITSEAICQWFSRVTKSRAKIIGESRHEWPQKSLCTVTNVLFYFLHAISYPEHTIPLKTIIDRWFRHCR